MPFISNTDPLEKPKANSKTQNILMSETKVKEVDPSRCKPWKYHNRDVAWLTRDRCQDLINSIENNGQNTPALVREIKGDPNFDFELIYGVRRWFACSQIPNQKLLAYLTDTDDKTCMVLMHAENAYSRDISEFERAFSFAQQMKSGIFKNQTEMAEAMGLTQGTISKMIKAAEILEHDWVKTLFEHKLDISVKYAYALSVLLKDLKHVESIKKESLIIKKEIEQTGNYHPPTFILKRLINSTKFEPLDSNNFITLLSTHKPIISCRKDKLGKVSILIENEAKKLNRAEVEEACLKAIRDYVFELFPGE